MTETDYELLSSYIDGELASPAEQELRRRLLAEPALRREYEALKAADARLARVLELEEASRVPGRVRRLLQQPGRDGDARRNRWGLAVAASLLAASGLLLLDRGADPAGPTLAAVLEQTPSRHQGWELLANGDRVRPVLTFRSTDGNWCREYLRRTTDGDSRAVACRDAGDWRTLASGALVADTEPGDYRPAGAGDVGDVAGFITDRAADIPLSAEQEMRLIADDWR